MKSQQRLLHLLALLAFALGLYGCGSSASLGGPTTALVDTQGFADTPYAAASRGLPPHLTLRMFVHAPRTKPAPATSPASSGDCEGANVAKVSGAGWRLPSSGLLYQVNSSTAPLIQGTNDFTGAIAASFTTWKAALSSRSFSLSIARGTDTSASKPRLDGINLIAFGKFRRNAIGITYAWYDPSTSLLAEADTILNLAYAWAWYPPLADATGALILCPVQPSAMDLQDITTHEFGHILGLDDMYDASQGDDTMYGYSSNGERKKDTLASGDLNGLATVYP